MAPVTVEKRPRLGARWVLLIALAAMILIFVLAIFAARRAHAAHGTYPDWLAAFATLAAFGAAGVAGWFAHNALLVEQERDERSIKADHERQASLVAVWGSLRSETATQNDREQFAGVWASLEVRNASPLPVTNALITVWVVAGKLTAADQFVKAPGALPLGRVLRSVLVPPTDKALPVEVILSSVADEMNALQERDRETSFGIELQLEFTDSVGNRWCRPPDGILRPITPEPW